MQGSKAGKRGASFWNRRKASRGWERQVSFERQTADDTRSVGHGGDPGGGLSDASLAAVLTEEQMGASGQRETGDKAVGTCLLTLAVQPQARLLTFLGLTLAHIWGGNGGGGKFRLLSGGTLCQLDGTTGRLP